MLAAGRFAPSPSGELHLGNLRTAAIAWLSARAARRPFLVRVEDLDTQRCRPEYADQQLTDLRAIGVDWDGEPMWQSDRDPAYRQALDALIAAGATFECYCTRKEIRSAQSAPHGDLGRYPGTCRDLSADDRARWRAAGRTPAIRLSGEDRQHCWDDLVRGRCDGIADDAVLARADGAIAYNLAVVVDDLEQNVGQIVRGDDLVDQTATQLRLTELLGGAPPRYGHVPLVLNTDGARLAKRDGAVTLRDLEATGWDRPQVIAELLRSMGAAVRPGVRTLADAVDGFALDRIPQDPWVFSPPRPC